MRKVVVEPKSNNGSRVERSRCIIRDSIRERKRNRGYEFQIFMIIMLL
jgi:hypothetical protein